MSQNLPHSLISNFLFFAIQDESLGQSENVLNEELAEDVELVFADEPESSEERIYEEIEFSVCVSIGLNVYLTSSSMLEYYNSIWCLGIDSFSFVSFQICYLSQLEIKPGIRQTLSTSI